MTKQWAGLLVLSAVTTSVVWAATRGPKRSFDDKEGLLWSLGVSIAGAEFGTHHSAFCNQNPGDAGTHYIYPDSETITPLAELGVKLMRLPVQWERLQPKLGLALNEDEMDRLDHTITLVGNAGGRVILDLHNYGRYKIAINSANHGSKIVQPVIDQEVAGEVFVSRDHLANFWFRIADRYRNNPVVIAYGLMNEPHDMKDSHWDQISQTAVDAIRETDRKTWILVSGDDWASSERFVKANGPTAWISDDVGKTAYEAHCYLDHDASGKYQLSYSEELRRDPQLANRSRNRLRPFAEWCSQNGVYGVVGEFGVPADDPDWNQLLSQMLEEMRQFDLSGCCWAAGPWWGEYEMSIEIGDPASGIPQSLRVLINAIEQNES